MEDNRKHPRSFIHWRSVIATNEHGTQVTTEGKTNDISIVGVSVICHRNIALHQTVTVYLLVDQGDQDHPQLIVEAQGKVMNNVLSGQQGGFRIGIQFTKFARDDKQVLLNHLPKDPDRSPKRATTPEASPAAAKHQSAEPSQEAVPEAEVDQPASPASTREDAPSEDS